MFAIRVECLTGRYVATAYDDRFRAEWPPHPSRLYSALVATWFETDGDTEERAALEFLETCGAPRIVAEGPDVARRTVVTHFVPVNDSTVLSEVNTGEKLAAAEAALAGEVEPKRRAKAEQALAKARANHDKRCADVIAPAKSSADALKHAMQVLPERRARRPRTFPSVHLADPVCLFVFAEDAGLHRQPLDRLCRRLARLGHSASLVVTRVVDEAPEGGWVPSEDGRAVLRWVGPGQFSRLEGAYQLHQATEPRVLPASFVAYGHGVATRHHTPPCSTFGDDWVLLHLRPAGRFRRHLPVTAAPDVARTVRGALMAHAGQPPLAILSGHRPSGEPSDVPHLAVVPLPDVAHQHADGHLLAIALILPREAALDERAHVFAALSTWLRADEDGVPTGRLVLGRLGEWSVCVDLDGDPRQGVQVSTWAPVHGARDWASVTPVALDRNPGDLLGGRDVQRAAHADAETGVALACERIGLPAPAQVSVSFRPPWRGSAKVDRHHPPFPRGADRLRRVQVHVRLSFDRPVRGPVLLGAGRYLGLGLFRPIEPQE